MLLSSSPVSSLAATANARVRKAVLFVDDEKSYVDLMVQLLSENLNCPVLSYIKPLEAANALPALDVGMIVTDYYMPAMNGIELIQRAATIAPHVPVIMITGHTFHVPEDELSRFPNLKATLHKPFSWTVLAREIVAHWPDANPPAIAGY